MTNSKDLPKINVLLAAYNGEQYIEEQIDSILNQENVDVTITVSLDLSTDYSKTLIEHLVEQHDNIILLPYGEKYGAAALNFYRLFFDSKIDNYDYIALSDQDDIWLNDKLITAINKLQENDAVGYSGNVTAFWANGTKREVIKATPQREYDYLFEGPGPGCSFVLTHDFCLEIKRYFKDNSELLKSLDWHDWVIYAYARSKGYNWFIDSESHMLYRQHSNNQLGANSGFAQFKKRVFEILSGYGISQTVDTVKFLKMENYEFVKKWYRNGNIYPFSLLPFSNKCRRRKKDQVLFLFSCFLMALFKTNYNPKATF